MENLFLPGDSEIFVEKDWWISDCNKDDKAGNSPVWKATRPKICLLLRIGSQRPPFLI
jgi:hypothetical protein